METPYLCSSEGHKYDSCMSRKTYGTQLCYDSDYSSLVICWRTEIFKMSYFRNKEHYRSEDLARDKFLGVLSQDGNKDIAGLANLDFRIL